MAKMYCLHCSRYSGCEFYEIFGEVGLELQLSRLLEIYFHERVQRNSEEVPQVLCDECVNQLIELFDLAELEREQQQGDVCIRPPIEDTLLQNNSVSTTAEEAAFLMHTIEEVPETISPKEEVEQLECGKFEVEAENPTKTEIIDEVVPTEINVLEDGENYEIDLEELTVLSESAEDNSEVGAGELLIMGAGDAKVTSLGLDGGVHYEEGDVEKYLNLAISTDLEEMMFDWKNECRDCSITIDTYQNLLNHIKISHKNEAELFVCILGLCEETFSTSKLLARHILLKHYDLPNLQVCGKCPCCETRFSNFLHLNKHSCCRTIKRTAGVRNYCGSCALDFPSFKRYVFHMQFHEPKRRPAVCLICEGVFTDIDEFFEHVHYRHHQDNKFMCIKCDRGFQNIAVFETHQRNHKNKDKYQCTLCFERYSYKQLLESHMKTFHRMDSKLLHCDLCSKSFANEPTYRKHLKGHIPVAEQQVVYCSKCGVIIRNKGNLKAKSECCNSNVNEEILSSAYTCEHCSLDFRDVRYLKNHRSSGIHRDEQFHCPLCKEIFKDLKQLRIHMKNHKDYQAWLMDFPLCRYYMCNVESCDETYPDWSSLYHHKKRNHKQYVCHSCNKLISNQKDYMHHEKSCQKNIQYICQVCGKICPNKMSLSVHIARSHNNANVVCPTCKGKYRGEDALKDHIEYMHVPVQCSHCHKVIKSKCNLEIHDRIVHKNEHRYFCELCGKGFYHRSERVTHLKNVHPVVTYKCSECPFSTNYVKSYEIHVAMHNKDYAFRCPICAKGFGRKYVLDMHVKRHQSKRQYVCSDRLDGGCKASFISNYLLNRHIEQKHLKPKLKPVRDTAVKQVKPNKGNSKAMFIIKEIRQLDSINLTEDMDTRQSSTVYYLEAVEDNCINLTIQNE